MAITLPRPEASVATLRASLLAWYDANARALPWRLSPAARAAGHGPDPYRVWLSEVMLQQTTVAHASAYFQMFTRRWPSLAALAGAPDGEVMAAWAGLGYYARARNLLACARAIQSHHGGVFPDSEAALRALPGVGGYTAAAIAAIAFDHAANVVDANVERVVARLFAVETPLPPAKSQLHRLAATVVTEDRPGDWPQALMDLGAVICRPTAPQCGVCPIGHHCRARALGDPAGYPRRLAKAPRPHRHGAAFVLSHGGKVALFRRPPKGLLGGMLGLPTTEWRSTPWTVAQTLGAAPLTADWILAGSIRHVFTHFSLTLDVWRTDGGIDHPGVTWLTADRALTETPTVFRKALRLAIG